MADSARLYIDPKNLQSIAYGTVDPTVTGVNLPMPSLYGNATTGTWYFKTGAGATAWSAFGTGTGAVSSVFGRSGAVVAAANDYTFAQIGSKPTTIAGYGITDYNSLGDARWLGIAATAAAATKLATARTIAGVSFDGTAAIAIPFANLSTKPTTIAGYGITDFNSLGDARWLGIAATAAAATKLATAQTINGVAFDGTAAITVAAAAGTLTGTALAATVTASSLTSVGTLTSLTSSGLVKGSSFQNTGSAGAAGWLQLAAGASPVSAQFQFGTDNSGWAYEIAKNAAGVTTSLLRLYDTGILDLMLSGGGINLAGVALARSSASYNQLYRRDGGIGIYLGGADTTNYYDNTGHVFRDRSAVVALTLNTTSAAFPGTVTATNGYFDSQGRRLHAIVYSTVAPTTSDTAYEDDTLWIRTVA